MSLTWIIFWIIIVITFVVSIIKKWGGNIKKILKTSQSTPTKSRAKKIWTIIFSILVIGLVLYIIVIVVINYLSHNQFDNKLNSDPPKNKKELSSGDLPPKSLPDSIIMLKDTIVEYYHLSQKSQKVIYTRPGYNYIRYSEGRKYYYKGENEPYFKIYGDGNSRADNVGIKYFYVQFYEVECNIKIKFFPLKKE